MNISYNILGYVQVFVEGDNALKLLNLCHRHNLPYGKTKRASLGVEFTFRLSRLKTLQKLCDFHGIEIKVIKCGGIPYELYKRRKRYGMLAGAVTALFLVFFAQQFIWKIDVVGNESITTREILKTLEDYGLYTGTYIPGINADRIQNRLLIDSNDISWVSVNINGNTATIEVRENTNADKNEQKSKPANLVAAKAGKIVNVQLLAGNAAVRNGDIVKEGELLVGGIFETTTEGILTTRAEGKVYAETTDEFYIKIPYKYEKKVYTGAQYYDKYLNFFDFSVKISKNSGNSGRLYDKISIMDNYSFFDGGDLPISKTTEIYSEYEILPAYRTPAEAEELAYFELSQRVAEATRDGTLLRKVILPEIHEDFFALRCVIVCIEDIAKSVEFEYEE